MKFSAKNSSTTDFDCLTKSDGFYSIGCKTEFIACANHRMFFFECPHNLIFNEEAQICDYAENIEDCSKMADVDELVFRDLIGLLLESILSL